MATTLDGLGIDIGGVIIDHVSEDHATAEGRARPFAGIPPVAGALDGIARLVRGRFGKRVWLVSRCDEATEARLLDWLERRDFYRATGVASGHVRFCRDRGDKVGISGSLGITHFIDDRLEVLSHMVGVIPHLYQLPSRAIDDERFAPVMAHVRRVTTWEEAVTALLDATR